MSDAPARYELSLETGFRGPLEMLLELIESRRLDIGSVSLAEVTGDFLSYLETLMRTPDPKPATVLYTIADFLSIASKLLLIKSKALLPSTPLDSDETESIGDLEARLVLYRRIKPVIAALKRAWTMRKPIGSRRYLAGYRRGEAAIFCPPPSKLEATVIHDVVARLLAKQRAVHHEVEEVRERVISLQSAVTELIGRIVVGMKTSFTKLTERRGRGDTLVPFLALLHLARDQKVHLTQGEPFSDIVVEHGSA